MREILFRGKHIHVHHKNNHLDGRWIEGYFADKNHINSPELEGEFLVDPETICQYTGLADKNGRKIFEGDVVKINDDVKEKFDISDGAVIYRGGSFIIGSDGGTLNSLFVIADFNYVFRGEVIGNIFDNPELMKSN